MSWGLINEPLRTPKSSERESQMEGVNHLTNSRMACHKVCRRKDYYCYEKGWRPKTDKAPLRIGSEFHEGVDLMAKGATSGQACQAIRANYDIKIIDSPSDRERELGYESVTVRALLAGYATAWQDSKIEIIESETSFDLPIINENGNPMRLFRQAGKRDRIGRLPDGRIALMETKTVSEDIGPGSDYRNILAINQQISMYVSSALAEGKNIETTLYDCIRKPTIKPTPVPLLDDDDLKIVLDAEGERVYNKTNKKPRQTASTADGYVLQTRPMTNDEWMTKLSADIATQPEKYYQRFEVPRLQTDLDEFNDELWMIAKDIGECRRLGRWYRNTANCRMWNSVCPYYPLCAGERDISNGVPDGFRQAKTLHEELE